MLTALGLDHFAVAAGWVHTDFACVGEWFLGSILFLYLVFPLLLWLCRRGRAARWGRLCGGLRARGRRALAGWDARLVAIHLPEFFFGMLFVSLAPARPGRRRSASSLAGLAALWGLGGGAADSKILCALFSAAVFCGAGPGLAAFAPGPV